jgi:AsmA-like C-terminal region
VTVEGEVTARILPFPSVTFSDVVVAGSTAEEPAVTAETFSMDAELAPFLRGEVLIFDMRLVRPKVAISIADDGKVDWAVRPSAPFAPSQISLEKLTVTEGQVSIRHAASGRTHRLTEINTDISARSFAGPWRADGTLRIDGMRSAVAVSTGKADENGTMRLKIKADPAVYPVALETDGDARLENGAVRYAGTFRLGVGSTQRAELRGGDGQTFKVTAEKPVKEGPRPNRINGKFSFDHHRLSIDEFRFETGPMDDPYTADGTAFIDLGAAPRFSIEANGAQVRFDEAVGKGEQEAGVTLRDRIAAVESVLVDLPKPGIPGTVEVNLPAVVAGDTTIREVRLSAEPVLKGWNLKSLAATLPGRTKLEGSGLLRTSDEIGFAGELLLAVAQPSGFAAWVSKDVDDAIRRMPAAGFRANVDMTTKRQRFSDLELILGAAKFRGEIDNRQPDDAKPSMQVRLIGDALDVDGMAAFASLFVSDKGTSRMADHDLDLDIKAGPVSAGGLTAETVDTALRLREGTLEIDRLSIGGLEGATISATGTVREFPANPSGDLDASVVAVDLSPLISVLAERYPDNPLARELRNRTRAYPGLFGDAQIDMVASAVHSGGGTSIALNASGKAGGSDFSLTASGNGNPETPETAAVSLAFSAANSNAEPLLALYGLPTLPLGVAGSGETTLQARGTLAGGLDTTLELKAPDALATFDGKVTAWNDALTAKGAVWLEAEDIEPWLMTAGVGLPGMGFGLPVALAAQADYGRGVLSLADLTGTVEEGAVDGDLRAELKEGMPHITGSLAADEIELGLLAGMVLGETALQHEGSPWPQAAFQQKVSAPFTADLDVSTGTVSAGPIGSASDVRMAARLDREGLRLADVSGKAFDGQLSGLFELKNTEGTGLLSAQLKLAGADVGLAFPATGLGGRSDATATVSATGKSVEAMVAALAGSGTAALRGLTIAGVNPNAFGAIVVQADVIGRDVDVAKTAAFAPPIVAAGTFAAKDAELAFSVAGGVLRAPPLRLEAPAAALTAEVRADLNSRTIAADGSIAYQPGDEKLVGSEPVVRFAVQGPLRALEKRFDTDPLAQFLTQRALEREQARVEAMQAVLLEKQRLRREVRYYASLQKERDRVAEELRRADEALRRKAEEEARRKAEEAARAAAEQAARAEAERQRAAEQALEEAARASAEAAAKAEAERQKAAEQKLEAARRRAEEDEIAQRAAEAIRLVERERARAEAERNAPKPAPEVERVPLPPSDSRDAPLPGGQKPRSPFLLNNLLKSLGQ